MPDLLQLRLWGENQASETVPHMASLVQNTDHQFAAHSGDHHRVRLPRRKRFKPVREPGFNPLPASGGQPVHMSPGPFQRPGPHIHCDSPVCDPGLHQVDGDVTVVRAHVRHPASRLHQSGHRSQARGQFYCFFRRIICFSIHPDNPLTFYFCWGGAACAAPWPRSAGSAPG